MKKLIAKYIFILIIPVIAAFIPTGTNINDEEAVKSVIMAYRNAIENLSVDGTDELFTSDAQIYESGGSEGSYQNYKSHHLGPELKHFKSFAFNNYKVNVTIDLPFAFTTETYVYKIVLKANPEKETAERTIEKKVVATAVLKKRNGTWKITRYHSSARNIRKNSH